MVALAPATTPNTKPRAIAEDILDRGFAIVADAMSSEEVAAVRGELAPWLQGEHFGRNNFEGYRTERVYALLAKAPAIARLVEHPVLLGVVDALLAPHYLLSSALAINIHPGETPQPFHADDSTARLPMPRPRPHVGISTMWALDDFTVDNGATEIVPGSHRFDDARFPILPEAASKAVMAAGSVVIFLGTLQHRGGANNSATPRLAITVQYCEGWLRPLENMSLAVPPALAAQYSERVQELLGYDTTDPGFMGHVDGLHPKRLLDAHYRGRRARGVPS